MNLLTTGRMAWGVFALSVTAAVVTSVLYFLNWPEPWNDFGFGDSPALHILAIPNLILLLVLPGLGAWLVSRRPENRIGWLFCLGGLCLNLQFLSGEYFVFAYETRPELPGDLWAAWPNNVTFFPSLWPIGLLLLFFPDGRLLSPRWRPAFWFAIVGIAAPVTGSALTPDLCLVVLEDSTIACPANPIELSSSVGEAMRVLYELGWVLIPIVVAVSAISLFLRFLQAGAKERQQIKWITSAGALVAGSTIATAASDSQGQVHLVAVAVLGYALLAVPVATAIAILRHNLYDIDRVINRTLVYAVLTAGLGTVYFGLILGLQALLRPVSGGSDLAIVTTTLVVAALFLPARRRVQEVVDRRFNRRAYDAARTIDAFSVRLQQQMDLDTLRGEVLAVLDETMQPEAASLWLRETQEVHR